jgi:3-methyladenine DNA glycosylase/8-oxoguanine DNA glycosylase
VECVRGDEYARTLAGIGEWTAQYIAMRALREPDAFPTGDIGLLRAMATESGRPTTAQLQARAAGWRPWRSYAALHLWASDPTDKRGAKEAPNETVVRSYVIADRNSAVRV